MAAKLKKRRYGKRSKTGHRAKFAMCAKHCRGDRNCMSRCLKGK